MTELWAVLEEPILSWCLSGISITNKICSKHVFKCRAMIKLDHYSAASANVYKIKIEKELHPANFTSYGAVQAHQIKITPIKVIISEKILFPNGETMIR